MNRLGYRASTTLRVNKKKNWLSFPVAAARRHLAIETTYQGFKEGPLRHCPDNGVAMMELRNEFDAGRVVGPGLDGQRALADGVQALVGLQHEQGELRDSVTTRLTEITAKIIQAFLFSAARNGVKLSRTNELEDLWTVTRSPTSQAGNFSAATPVGSFTGELQMSFETLKRTDGQGSKWQQCKPVAQPVGREQQWQKFAEFSKFGNWTAHINN